VSKIEIFNHIFSVQKENRALLRRLKVAEEKLNLQISPTKDNSSAPPDR
jgi:hypothetical protein